METSTNRNELQTIGISRSGRIRKKSSKLVDFQSPDIEPKSKRAGNKLTPKVVPPKVDESDNVNVIDETFISNEVIEGLLGDDNNETDDKNTTEHPFKKSLYLSEKTVKHKLFKTDKRKDKGKNRITAYMLWARSTKKSVTNHSNNPESMWANVPMSEKSGWRRRARFLSQKAKKMDIKPGNKNPGFLTRVITSQTKPVANPKETLQKKNITKVEVPKFVFENSKLNHNDIIQPGVFRITGINPLDTAAHLKLLGDSLTLIGERLKEHEGQITVSGSLSVLLDSLLCSLGPLICLTTYVPELADNNKVLEDNLHKTLDNIAYVMPGL